MCKGPRDGRGMGGEEKVKRIMMSYTYVPTPQEGHILFVLHHVLSSKVKPEVIC